MKSSTRINLVLLATVSAIALAACGKDDSDGTLVDASQCQLNPTTPGCNTSEYKEALAEHQKTAPRFTSKEDCEAKFGAGACAAPQPAPAGGTAVANNSGGNAGSGGWFMPAMMGYLIGSSMHSSPQPVYVYPDPNDRERRHYYTGGGGYVGTVTAGNSTRASTFTNNTPPASKPSNFSFGAKPSFGSVSSGAKSGSSSGVSRGGFGGSASGSSGG